eukprot:10576-Heterococcus_DN1.PRE.1
MVCMCTAATAPLTGCFLRYCCALQGDLNLDNGKITVSGGITSKALVSITTGGLAVTGDVTIAVGGVSAAQ